MIYYAECKGTITQATIKTPENGKPHTFIQVLQPPQAEGEKASLPEFKDQNLNNQYSIGEQFFALVKIQDWSMGDRSGASAQVVRKLNGNGSKTTTSEKQKI